MSVTKMNQNKTDMDPALISCHSFFHPRSKHLLDVFQFQGWGPAPGFGGMVPFPSDIANHSANLS